MRFGTGTVVAIALTCGFADHASAQGGLERANRGVVEIIAGGADSTDLRAAEELAFVLDDGATRRVVPVVGKGSTQNILDLRALRGVDLGIIQTDVFAAAKAQQLIPGLDSSITYIAKLFNEEFHLLARDPIVSIDDLQGKKVNFGVAGGGTSITGPQLFQLLKIKVEATSFDQAVALTKLTSGEIAAMAFVMAKPAPFFVALPPRSGFRLIAVPQRPELLNDYIPSRLLPEDYPNLVAQPVDTIAVGAVLAVANLATGTERYRNVANFVDAFFTQFGKLLEPPRHPKWREVNLAAEVPGWRRFPPAETWLKNNATQAPSVEEAQLRAMFASFLDERSRLARGRPLTPQQKDEMYEAFKKWQSSQKR